MSIFCALGNLIFPLPVSSALRPSVIQWDRPPPSPSLAWFAVLANVANADPVACRLHLRSPLVFTPRMPRQSKTLRSLSATIPWELSQMRGGYVHTERLSVQGLLFSKGYADLGIEVEWAPMTTSVSSARVATSDGYADLLADLSLAIVLQHVRRNMTFSHGLPRRQVCILDSELGPNFVKELQADWAIHCTIMDLQFPGVDLYLQRSVFNLVSVKQLLACLRMDDFVITDRTLERCSRFCSSLGALPAASGKFCEQLRPQDLMPCPASAHCTRST